MFMKNWKLKFWVFVFTWYCTTLLVNFLITIFWQINEKSQFSKNELLELISKDAILSLVITGILLLTMYKNLSKTFKLNS